MEFGLAFVEETVKRNLHTVNRGSVATIDSHLAIVADQHEVDGTSAGEAGRKAGTRRIGGTNDDTPQSAQRWSASKGS